MMASLHPQLLCTLDRQAYLSGDTVHCEICVTAPTKVQPLLIDFLSAQLHGHVSFDPRRVSFDEEANKTRRIQRSECDTVSERIYH